MILLIFDFFTWSIWLVGASIWVIWAYYSLKEFRVILRSQKNKK